ncbi:MAG: hypothetical protein WBD99_03190 [Thermodesulfobacteriota bacterium]
MSIKLIFWLLVIVIALYVGFKVVPIYYKGIIGMRGLCQENADIYHKYGSTYISNALNEQLTRAGIPPDKRKISITSTEDAVVITIAYHDQADFFGRYRKDFDFRYTCEGVVRSVYN